MKLTHLASLFTALSFTAAVAFAADKEVTLTGTGQCAKCALGKTESCQTALVVKTDGKEEVYLLADNAVSKGFHDNVCDSAKAVKVTGVVKETAGKKEITASKIELVKS